MMPIHRVPRPQALAGLGRAQETLGKKKGGGIAPAAFLVSESYHSAFGTIFT
jgi:hypothetical protein